MAGFVPIHVAFIKWKNDAGFYKTGKQWAMQEKMYILSYCQVASYKNVYQLIMTTTCFILI